MSGRGRGSQTIATSTRSSLKIEGTSVPLSSMPTGRCLVQLAEEDSRALAKMKNIAEEILQDYKSRLEGKEADDVLVVHDDVHIDIDRAKLEKGTLPTPTTVESGTYAIVDAMVVDACTDAIVDATVVDACTNDIVDAMEVDASTNAATDGNVNNGETESIVHAVIDAFLDAVEAMGIDATIVSGTHAIVDDMVVDAFTDAIVDATVVDACTNDIVDAMEVDASIDVAADGNVNDGAIKSIVCAVIDAILYVVEAMVGASDVTAQAEVVCPSDATVEDTRGRGEEVLIEREAGTCEAVGASDVSAHAEVVCPSDATDDIVDAEEVEDMRGLGEENLTKTIPGIGSAVGNSDVAAFADTSEIATLPLASCEEKKRRDNLCIILDVNGLLIRRYKVSYYKGIARSSTPDLARSKYLVVTGPNVIGKMQFEYVVRPNASTFLDALLTRAQVVLWSCMTSDNLAFDLSACFP
ncbi:hypothetical protein L7F22_069226 [Adiantum nelumboides]|nr:hypothetical protein [Adiantum nelumboides]